MNQRVAHASITDPRLGQPQTTAIVVGLAARETSLVAGVLRDLGFKMSEDADARKLALLLEDGGRIDELRTLIERHDSTNHTWGFEVQRSFRLLPRVLHLFRNPRVLVAFRDPVTSATGTERAVHAGLGELLTRAAAENLALAELVRAMPEAALAVSYERAVVVADAFVSSLADHCGLHPREGRRLRAIRSVKRDRESQTETAPLWYEGELASVDRQVARGWARRMPANEPCMVEIVSDGVSIGRGVSNRRFRSDDECISDRGFAVELTAPPSSALVARIAGTTIELAFQGTGRAISRPPS